MLPLWPVGGLCGLNLAPGLLLPSSPCWLYPSYCCSPGCKQSTTPGPLHGLCQGLTSHCLIRLSPWLGLGEGLSPWTTTHPGRVRFRLYAIP